jgi:hypothetical protein
MARAYPSTAYVFEEAHPAQITEIQKLQNPQLVTSYALPPSAAFALAPFSVYRKGSSKASSQRFTYASITGSIQTDRSQLICFHEKSSGDGTETAKTAYTPSGSAQILALDALPVPSTASAPNATHDVLATFDNGDMVCLSADLETVQWTAQLPSPKIGSVIDHVSTATAKAVTRGLLRSREDIASVLNPTSDDASDLQELTQVLCVIGRKSNGSITLSLVQVQSRSPDLTTNSLSPLKHLVSWALPDSARFGDSTTPIQYSLHAASGILHVLQGKTVISFDVSDNVPRLYSELTVPGLDVDSFLRISQDVLFTTSQHLCRVFDAGFNTLQAFHYLDPSSIPSPASPVKKRKLPAPEPTQESAKVNLLAYYPDHNLVVAVRENELVGMQFEASSTYKRSRHNGTSLADALGKGVSSDTACETQKWQDRKARLDRYVSKGKIHTFEKGFFSDLGILQVETAESQNKQDNEVNGGPLTNGVGPKIPDEDAEAIGLDQVAQEDYKTWDIPTVVPDFRKQQYRQYALYALSRIFRLTTTGQADGRPQTKLKIGFFRLHIFEWLLQTGHLSAASIRHAILEESPQNAQFLSSVVDGDIIQSLVDFDPDLHILSAVLNHSGHLPVGEVVQAIKLLMQSLDEQPEAHDAMKLLTNGVAETEDEMDVDITSELEAATHEVDHALSVLDHGLLIRSHILRPALTRLHSFSPRVITSTLRTMLPRRDLESLINVLHLEMKNGGWSSPIDSSESENPTTESSDESPDDHAVAIIASLLSCTLDAIGAGAWLATVGDSADFESTEDIIDALQSDTSEALNGFWEARYMRGLLGEFLRFASNVPKSHKPSAELMMEQGKPFTVSQDDSELPMLPLGAKPDMGIERMKAGKGGKKEERSAREMGMLISKQVPKYSFERIVL